MHTYTGLEGDGRESSLAGCRQHPRFSKCFVVLLTAGLRGDGRESSVAGCGLTFMLGHANVSHDEVLQRFQHQCHECPCLAILVSARAA